jgi:hypothetical protein
VSDEGAILDVDTGSWEPLPAPPIAADEGAVAVWAGDRLVVWGGIRWKSSERGPSVVIDGDPLVSDQAEIVEAGWSWIPTSQ